MNTQGWIRGLISSNTEIDKLCSFILRRIEKEFQRKGEVSLVNNNYVFKIDRYLVSINVDKVKKLQKVSPYALDKAILDILREQGLKFNYNRSQYIRYCYGLI